MMYDSDSELEDIQFAQLATARVIKELYCNFPSNFYKHIYDFADSSETVILAEFFDSYSTYEVFADSVYDYLGYDIEDVLNTGYPYHDIGNHTMVYRMPWGFPSSNAIPRWPHIGVGTDVPDFDDDTYEYIPGLVNSAHENCNYEEGMWGPKHLDTYSEQSEGLVVVPIVGQAIGGIVLAAIVVNGVIQDTWNVADITNWESPMSNETQPSGCRKANEIWLDEMKITVRNERDRRSEVYYTVCNVLNTTVNPLANSYYAPYWRPLKVDRIHKNDLPNTDTYSIDFIPHQTVGVSADYRWFYHNYNTGTATGMSFQSAPVLVGMTFEYDWYARRQVFYAYQSGTVAKKWEMHGRMKYRDEYYQTWLFEPYDQCSGTTSTHTKDGYVDLRGK